MTDAEKIKQLINARGWTQNKFSKETGVAQSYISYIIRGQKSLTDHIARKICTALRIDISYFEKQEEIEEEVQEETEEQTIQEDDISNYKDIVEIAKTITDLRAILLEKIKEERENDKKYNGIDQDFLHGIENLDKLSEKEAIEMVLKERDSRKNRRVTKNRIFFIQGMLNGLTITDYYKFVMNGYEQTKNFKYNPRTTEALNPSSTPIM